MRKTLFALTMVATTAGCLQVPQTPAEVRTHPWTKPQTASVNRSASAAMNTIANRARSCLNFTMQTSITRSGQMSALIRDSYRTRREDSSLVMEHNNPANIGNPGWYPYLVADVTSTGSGSQVTTYASPGNGVFVDAIQAWARGDTTPCPRTDLG